MTWFCLASSLSFAPGAVAATLEWPLNSFLSGLALYLGTIVVATPTAAIACFVRWGRRIQVDASAGQRLVDASIWMVAASAVIGWSLVAFVFYGDALRVKLGLRSDRFLLLVFVPPALALLSGVLAVAGKGKGRAVVLSGFGVMLLAVALLVLVANQKYTGPAPSY